MVCIVKLPRFSLQICQDCLLVDGKLCSCLTVRYCSEKCQRADYPIHRYSCGAIRKWFKLIQNKLHSDYSFHNQDAMQDLLFMKPLSISTSHPFVSVALLSMISYIYATGRYFNQWSLDMCLRGLHDPTTEPIYKYFTKLSEYIYCYRVKGSDLGKFSRELDQLAAPENRINGNMAWDPNISFNLSVQWLRFRLHYWCNDHCCKTARVDLTTELRQWKNARQRLTYDGVSEATLYQCIQWNSMQEAPNNNYLILNTHLQLISEEIYNCNGLQQYYFIPLTRIALQLNVNQAHYLTGPYVHATSQTIVLFAKILAATTSISWAYQILLKWYTDVLTNVHHETTVLRYGVMAGGTRKFMSTVRQIILLLIKFGSCGYATANEVRGFRVALLEVTLRFHIKPATLTDTLVEFLASEFNRDYDRWSALIIYALTQTLKDYNVRVKLSDEWKKVCPPTLFPLSVSRKGIINYPDAEIAMRNHPLATRIAQYDLCGVCSRARAKTICPACQWATVCSKKCLNQHYCGNSNTLKARDLHQQSFLYYCPTLILEHSIVGSDIN